MRIFNQNRKPDFFFFFFFAQRVWNSTKSDLRGVLERYFNNNCNYYYYYYFKMGILYYFMQPWCNPLWLTGLKAPTNYYFMPSPTLQEWLQIKMAGHGTQTLILRNRDWTVNNWSLLKILNVKIAVSARCCCVCVFAVRLNAQSQKSPSILKTDGLCTKRSPLQSASPLNA